MTYKFKFPTSLKYEVVMYIKRLKTFHTVFFLSFPEYIFRSNLLRFASPVIYIYKGFKGFKGFKSKKGE